jgi:hypothetical protein
VLKLAVVAEEFKQLRTSQGLALEHDGLPGHEVLVAASQLEN